MLLTNNKMLKGLNRFHGSVDSKKKADYDRLAVDDIYQAGEYASKHPEVFEGIGVLWKHSRGTENLEIVQLFLSGIRTYFIAMEFKLSVCRVNEIGRIATRWILDKISPENE